MKSSSTFSTLCSDPVQGFVLNLVVEVAQGLNCGLASLLDLISMSSVISVVPHSGDGSSSR